MRSILFLFSVLMLAGCASTGGQTELEKSKYIVLELEAQLVDKQVVAEPDKPKVKLPEWVVGGSDYYGYDVGVACEEFPLTSGYSALIKAKALAKDNARLALFRVNGGMQKIHATEKFKTSGEEKQYDVTISTLSSGRFWRNEVVDEAVIEDGLSSQYCVSIKFDS